jgi:hypothetical protein
MEEGMLDFTAVRARELTFNDLIEGLTAADLRALTNEMVDQMLALIAGCTDADVTFQPVDLAAHDPYTVDPSQMTIAWTLGHVIVHTTASAEESAALAAELARGIAPLCGDAPRRSRYEVPWESVTTIAACRRRLEESRRMRLASLEMWPDLPLLETTYTPWPSMGAVNAIGRFVMGLRHDHDHLGQIADVAAQAQEARR